MKNLICLIVLFTLFSAIKLGECSIKCYVCDSKSNPGCVEPDRHNLEPQECFPKNLPDLASDPAITKLADAFDIDIEVNNNTDALSCIKVVSTVGDEVIVVRGCQVEASKSDFCEKLLKEAKDVVQHCSLCDEDGCNGN